MYKSLSSQSYCRLFLAAKKFHLFTIGGRRQKTESKNGKFELIGSVVTEWQMGLRKLKNLDFSNGGRVAEDRVQTIKN